MVGQRSRAAFGVSDRLRRGVVCSIQMFCDLSARYAMPFSRSITSDIVISNSELFDMRTNPPLQTTPDFYLHKPLRPHPFCGSSPVPRRRLLLFRLYIRQQSTGNRSPYTSREGYARSIRRAVLSVLPPSSSSSANSCTLRCITFVNGEVLALQRAHERRGVRLFSLTCR